MPDSIPSSGGYPNPVPSVNPPVPSRRVGPEDTPDDPEKKEGQGDARQTIAEQAEGTRQNVVNVTYGPDGKPLPPPPPPPSIDKRA